MLPIITKNLKRATNKKETKTEKKNKNTKMAKYVKRAKKYYKHCIWAPAISTLYLFR